MTHIMRYADIRISGKYENSKIRRIVIYSTSAGRTVFGADLKVPSRYQLVLSSVMARWSLEASMITRLSSDPLPYSSMSAPLRVRQFYSSSTRPARETGALRR